MKLFLFTSNSTHGSWLMFCFVPWVGDNILRLIVKFFLFYSILIGTRHSLAMPYCFDIFSSHRLPQHFNPLKYKLKNWPPLTRQNTNYTCGPTCLLSWLRFKGIHHFSEMDLAKKLSTNPEVGTLSEHFVSGIKKLGFKSKKIKNTSYLDLIKYFNNNYGVILYVKSGISNHWVLLADINKHNVVVMDPWTTDNGFRYINKRDLLKIWNGSEARRLALVFTTKEF